MNGVEDKILAVKKKILELERQNGRPKGSVTLLGVSKRQSTEKIREAAAAGLIDFGENYLQEALDKIAELGDLALEWHFIGPIQSNKTRPIAAAPW